MKAALVKPVRCAIYTAETRPPKSPKRDNEPDLCVLGMVPVSTNIRFTANSRRKSQLSGGGP